MNEQKYEIGIIGLGVMGANLALNIAEHGFSVVGHDLDQDKVDALLKHAQDQLTEADTVYATTDSGHFLNALRRPRAILLLVPAGQAVDAIVNALQPGLEREDVIIDGGNSHFTDTDRRATLLARHCIHFMGLGVSGGADGARHGPSMMAGGSKAAWERVQPILEAAAAKVGTEPCVAWLGRDSAGHYVKMAHNGIEYGLMQLIAESYDLLKRGLQFDQRQMHTLFADWAQGQTGSYLIEITANIMQQHDTLGEGYLLDKILDAARQKGTGMWTSQEALEINTPNPVIDIAVAMRALSDYQTQRQRAGELLAGPDRREVDKEAFVRQLENALYAAFILTYAQGFHLLHNGSDRHGYGTHMADVARIWRGGCIIRARLLEDLHAAYTRDPALPNPILDDAIAEQLQHHLSDLRQIVQTAAGWGLPAPAFMAALGYYDAYRSPVLPANLIQAQRDYFGAHTFERTDRDGTFHNEWTTS